MKLSPLAVLAALALSTTPTLAEYWSGPHRGLAEQFAEANQQGKRGHDVERAASFEELSAQQLAPVVAAAGVGDTAPAPTAEPTAVPEPKVWALLLAGLAALGYVARRR
jgi:hypothetical protein